jgi:hypothetical protein
MAVLGVALREGFPALAGTGGDPAAALRASLAATSSDSPVVVLIHGWRLDPGRAARDPHRTVFAPAPASGWPGALGFDGRSVAEGLCIGFGWAARAAHLPTLLAEGRTGFARVCDRAEAAGAGLARLIGTIAVLAPGRRVDLLAHSLGARVALAALPALGPEAAAALGRLILLGGAEFAGRAETSIRGFPGPEPEVYSITARHNDLYDALFEAFAPRGGADGPALSRGLPRLRNWLTLQIDHPRFRAWAAGRGIVLSAPAPLICHGSFHADPGAMTLYRTILREREVWSVAALRDVPALAATEPRWSRLRTLLPRFPDAGANGGRRAARSR